MRDLAPDIVRQRLLLEGHFTIDVDEEAIRRFLTELTSSLHLRAYGEATIFSPRGLGSDDNQGFDAFLPLIDSGVSLYVWSTARFLALVIFTCKAFDEAEAVACTRRFFAMTDSEHHAF